MDVREGEAPFGDHRTWYRVTGDLAAAQAPLVVAHGGPGCTHDYVDSFKLLAGRGRAVVHYDQIGNGRSTHRPDAPKDFWTVGLFLDELGSLLRHLGIERRYHLLGQSWGGMLGMEHAVRRPAGLKSLVIADSPASLDHWVAEANRLREALPPDTQAALLRHEAAGTTDHPEYEAAVRVFYDRHVCRVPWPPEVERTFAAIAADPTVYHTMNGPSEFHVIGTLAGWSIVERLHEIAVPTLTISGRHDEATPAIVKVIVDRVPDIRWEIFEESSHMPHVEETGRCMAVVGDFLDAHDA